MSRWISARIDYRNEEIAARYRAYRDKAVQSEIGRTVPGLAMALQKTRS